MHSDAKALALNTIERDGQALMLVGPVDEGLADPGSMALIALHQSLVTLLFAVDDVSPTDLWIAQAHQSLVDQACDTLARAEASGSDD